MGKFEDVLKNERPHGVLMSFALMVFSIFIQLLLALTSIVILIITIVSIPELMNSVAEGKHNTINFNHEIFVSFRMLTFFAVFGLIALLWRSNIEKLSAYSLFSNSKKFRFEFFIFGTLTCAIIYPLVIITDVYYGLNLSIILEKYSNIGILQTFIIIFTYYFAVIIQSGTEEIIFRAQLTQDMRRLKLPLWTVILIVNILFGSMHSGKNINISVVFATTMLGIAFAYSVWRTNGIEFAIGVHSANNFFSMALNNNLDNSDVGKEAYLVSVIYFLLVIGLLELFLKLFPDFLKEKGRFISGADLIA
jgi:membrane protease YdiL (CAAX protease family)